MSDRARWMVVLGVVALTIACWHSDSFSATSTGSGFYLENLGIKLFALCKNVVVPLLLIGIVVFAGCNVAFGWVQMGPGLSRMLLGGAIIAGGIETILLLVGGTGVATAALLP